MPIRTQQGKGGTQISNTAVGSEHCKSKGRDVYESTLEKFEDLDMNVPRIEGLRQMISRITVRLMHRSRAMEN